MIDRRRVKVAPGRAYPLGATWDGQGVNFALFSEHGSRVELCLFDPKGRREIARVVLPWRTDHVWHAYLPDARPGLLYGYRVHGSYDSEHGLRFNPNKLLLDPYARDVVGELHWSDAQFGYRVGGRYEDLAIDRRNSAGGMPKCRVIDPAFTWGDDAPPRVPWRDSVIYELHVKGFTRQHPEVSVPLRGTYGALATDPVIRHFRRLGVTAIELMPVHAFVDDRYLIEKGLRNYWGYNSIGFFAPDARYALADPVREFKMMVRRLHAAGIEVILDVVYNHTAEGNHLGPTLCFRGIDNPAYYRLTPKSPRYYLDFTGCGNTLNMTHPQTLQLVMDSLRYWVTEMHVDGFRFDLAAALAREAHDVDQRGAFFDIIHQDPVLSQVKLIAEPWDLGERGYQVGNFPLRWSEWNGRYRDAVRAYWRGDPGIVGEVASRLTGSSDLYQASGRKPHASINFVTAHDGFTLEDLVSYNEKHNEANLEGNRDGADNNLSWNCGIEGATDAPDVTQLRARQKRNFLATLFLSQGVPMLLAGDEMSHTQRGNNNAYCQDNDISWIAWREDLLIDFIASLAALRRAHPVLRREAFFRGHADGGAQDILWLTPSGREMSDEDWHNPLARVLGALLVGRVPDVQPERRETRRDDNLLLLFNAYHEELAFTLPASAGGAQWERLLDTARADTAPASFRALEAYPLAGRSVAVLRAGDTDAARA